MALLISVPASGFIRLTVRDPDTGKPAPVAWRQADFPIAYSIQRQGPSELPEGAHVAVIQDAFLTWEKASGASVRFQFDGLSDTPALAMDGSNTIHFSADSDDFNAPSTVATTSFFAEFPSFAETTARLVEADIIINDAHGFSINDPPLAFLFDLQAVVTHEIGHLLGFDHSPVDGPTESPARATMITFLRRGQADERTLAPDDLAGLTVVYRAEVAAAERGRIEGRITDATGRGLFGALVLARSLRRPDDIVIGTLSGLASSLQADAGGYRIAGLMPGRYLIEVRQTPSRETAATFLGADFNRPLAEVRKPAFFENAATLDDALPLEVGAGATLRGIDLRGDGSRSTVGPDVFMGRLGFVLEAPAQLTLEITTPRGNGADDLGLFRLSLDGAPLLTALEALTADRQPGVQREVVSSQFLRLDVALPPISPGRHEFRVSLTDHRGAGRTERAELLVAAETPPKQVGADFRFIAEGDANVELRLTAAYELEGSLRDRLGAAVANASLRFRADSAAKPFFQTVTNGDGEFRLNLPPAIYRMTLETEDGTDAPRPIEPQEITITGTTHQAFTLADILPTPPTPDVLPELILVSGRVRDMRGSLLAGALVQLFRPNANFPAPRGATNSTGRFQIVVAPNEYEIAVSPPLLAPSNAHPMPLQLGARQFAADTELRITLPNGFAFRGQAVDALEQPLPFTNLRFTDHLSGRDLFVTAADESGSFDVLLEAGVYDIEFDPLADFPENSRAIATRLEQFVHTAPAELMVALPDGIVISGAIFNQRAHRVGRALVTVRQTSGGSLQRSVVTNRNGAFRVAVPAGRFLVQVDPPASVSIADRAVRTIMPAQQYQADTEIAITLNDGVLLRGAVRDLVGAAIADASVLLRGVIENTAFARSTLTDEGGNFRFLVPRGGYRLTVSPPP